MKTDLDKFYTPIEISKKCIEEINVENYDVIVEPSAGNGSFSKQIKNCLAYDIAPEDSSIIKQDFLELKKIEGNHILFIGNPPFGNRSALAKKFIEHSIALNAETIAFILPNTFNKYLMQKVFPKEWKLIKIIELNCEYKANKVDYFVPSSFFVWTKKESDVNLRKEKPKPITDFKFLSRGDKSADFTISGLNGRIIEVADVKNTKGVHYIKVNEGHTIEEIKNKIKNTHFDFYSSVNGGNCWISQKDIEEKYNESWGN